MTRSRGAGALCGALLLVGGVAFAQPFIGANGMPDPSKMSGIPRPDPQVPAGTITVRVLRGDFGHPLVGQKVTLDGPGGAHDATTDASGRATLGGLAPGGPYVAKTTASGATLSSQPIELPSEPGVRVMLVFPLDDKALVGAPDGKARRDESIAAGTLVVKVVNGDGAPVPSATVVLGHALHDDDATRAAATDGGAGPAADGKGVRVEEKRATTDAEGTARFAGLATSATEAYAVKAVGDGASAISEPFHLGAGSDEKPAGRVVALRLARVESTASLRVGDKSHFVLELHDDDVQVAENLFLENPTGAPMNPGPGGLVLPLPEGASGAQAQVAGADGDMAEAPQPGKPSAQVVGDAVKVVGPLPPGDTTVQVLFTLPVTDGGVTLRQKTPIAWPQLLVVTDPMDGLTVEPSSVTREERAAPGAGGRTFLLLRGPGPAAGGEAYLRVAGLPERPVYDRAIATALAALLALWGVVAASTRRRSSGAPVAAASEDELAPDAAAQSALAVRRAALMDELVALERERLAAATAGSTPPTDKSAQATEKATDQAAEAATIDKRRGRATRRRGSAVTARAATAAGEEKGDARAARREALVEELAAIDRALDEAAAEA